MTKWRALQLPGIAILSAFALATVCTTADARSLDENGEISLGLRAYQSARIQTEDTDRIILKEGPEETAGQYFRSLTFPISKAGQLRQARYFIEVELKHNIQRLYEEGFGPLQLLHYLPFDLKRMRYQLIYRGEGDLVYDIGPRAFRTREQYHLKGFPELPNANVPAFSGNSVQAVDPGTGRSRLDGFRRELRDTLSNRNRLFQAFVDFQIEDLFVRFGRQILVWGETDAFRLLDNINPVDNGFGGFLIPLDERRVPLDMLRLNYYFGDFDDFGLDFLGLREAYIEGFWAIDNAVGWYPGINIKGSPWALPNLGEPSATQFDAQDPPERNIENSRGGFQFKFNTDLILEDVTLGVAHYYTFFDTPQVQSFVHPQFPTQAVPPGVFGSSIGEPNPLILGLTLQRPELTQVTGVTGTFAIPARWSRKVGFSGEPIIRTELAYFKDEPRHQQERLDPFLYAQAVGCGTPDPNNPGGTILDSYVTEPGNPNRDAGLGPGVGFGLCTVDPRPGDSWNFVLGVDTNQFIRWLNNRTSFFITTQFFYKHLNGAAPRRRAEELFPEGTLTQPINYDRLNNPPTAIRDSDGSEVSTAGIPVIYGGEGLPVPAFRIRSPLNLNAPTATQPSLARSSTDQFLQTLLISTSYASGQIVPSLTAVYDWGGAVAVIPQVTFLRDPFRLTFSYSYLEANSLKGNAGVSLLRDRDNFLVQFEYVL